MSDGFWFRLGYGLRRWLYPRRWWERYIGRLAEADLFSPPDPAPPPAGWLDVPPLPLPATPTMNLLDRQRRRKPNKPRYDLVTVVRRGNLARMPSSKLTHEEWKWLLEGGPPPGPVVTPKPPGRPRRTWKRSARVRR